MSAEGRSASLLSLQVLATLALLYTIYFAKSLLMPVVVALFFALLLSPLVNALKRFLVPRSVSAVLILALIGGPMALLGSQLAEPAQRWAEAIPRLADKLSDEVDDLTDKLSSQAEEPPAQEEKGFSFFGLFDGGNEKSDDSESSDRNEGRVSERLKQGGLELLLTTLSAAPVVIAQLLTTVLMILFLLIFGPRLFAAAVEFLPVFSDRRASMELVRTVQTELSRYILTVSVINADNGGSGLRRSSAALFDYSHQLGSDEVFSAGEASGTRTLRFSDMASEMFSFDIVVSGYQRNGAANSGGDGADSTPADGSETESDPLTDVDSLLRVTVNPLTGTVVTELVNELLGNG